jgi:response regulator RpfG family c-di-GMP phosphodiesterase
MSLKILCVDDDANVLAGYQRNLRKQFNLDTALSGQAGLAMLDSQGPYAVVVADMNMPGMNGIQFLMEVQRRAPDTVRIMLTGNADQQTAIAAVNQGHVFQFLTKPCPTEALASALRQALRQYQLVVAERELLEKTLNGSIKVLVDVLSMADPQSFGFGQKLRDAMRTFAKALNVEQCWELELAAMLSPIGYVTIPPAVLQKHRAGLSLSGPERDMIERVPEFGANLLANIPRLEPVARIVRYHAKRFDGTGFPADEVKGEDIPVGARILKVLSDLVQLEAKGLPRHKALEQMRTRTGWYDPRVLSAAFACFDVYLPEGPAAPAAPRAVSLSDLRVGHILAEKVVSNDGVVIAGPGTEVTQMVLQKLHNFAQLSGIKEPILIEA